MKFIIPLTLSLLVSSCGEREFKYDFKTQSAEDSRESLVDNFQNVLTKSDRIEEGDQAADKFAVILFETQLQILNNSSANKELGVVGEKDKGICLMLSAGKPFDAATLPEDLLISDGGQVVYSKSESLVAESCQDFFKEHLPEQFNNEFFDLHISFYSLTL